MISSCRQKLLVRILQKDVRNETTRKYNWQLQAVPNISPSVDKWNRAVDEAAELTSLDWSVNGITDALGKAEQIAKLIRKVVGTNHPIIQQYKNLFSENRTTFQIRGTIAMLVAKAAGHGADCPSTQEHQLTELQKTLAKAIELYYAHFVTHKSVLNLKNEKEVGEVNKSLQFTNGIAILWGDYLASSATYAVATLKNSKVLGLMSQGVSDFTEAGYLAKDDKNGNMIPDAESPLSVWEEATAMEHASLLARGCEGMMVLAGHNEKVQETARHFGKYISLAMKVNQDIDDFRQLSKHYSSMPFSLSMAPVILHLQDDKELLRQICNEVEDDVAALDFKLIHGAVQAGDGMEKTQALLKHYIDQAIQSLRPLGPSSASKLLENMLQSLEDN